MATTHLCPWPACKRQVPLHMWGCGPHWFSLPTKIRAAIWDAYRSPEGALGEAYRVAMAAAMKWIADRLGDQPKTLASKPKLFTTGEAQ